MNYISQQEPNQMWIKKVLMLVLADILIVLISYFMALLLRFDFVFSSILLVCSAAQARLTVTAPDRAGGVS